MLLTKIKDPSAENLELSQVFSLISLKLSVGQSVECLVCYQKVCFIISTSFKFLVCQSLYFMISTSFKFLVCADLLCHRMAFIIALALKHSFYLCFDLCSFEAQRVYFLNYPPPPTPLLCYSVHKHTLYSGVSGCVGLGIMA